MGECPAKEVFSYQNKEGYFASSIDIRKPRPPNVAYRVGQVIKHKKWGYRGVIVGWDEKAKVNILICSVHLNWQTAYIHFIGKINFHAILTLLLNCFSFCKYPIIIYFFLKY